MCLNRASGRSQFLEQDIGCIDLRRCVPTKFSFYTRREGIIGIVEEDIAICIEHPDAFDRNSGMPAEVAEIVAGSMQLTSL